VEVLWPMDRAVDGGEGQPGPVGVGKFNRKPKTEPKEPGTGTERTETENFGSLFGS